MTDLRECSNCHEKLPFSDYYKHPYGKHGLLHNCKECHKMLVRENRKRKRERYQEYDRERGARPERRAQVSANAKRAKARNPERSRARHAAANAIRDGRLAPEPCEGCGHDTVQAHHPDYSKPLDVVWLCFSCHRAEHGQHGVKNSPAAPGRKVPS